MPGSRPPLTAQELEAIYNLGPLINERNFSDILRLLSKVHFYRRVPGADLFHWLTEIAQRSGNPHFLHGVVKGIHQWPASTSRIWALS